MFLPLWHAKPQTVIEDGEKVRQLKVENEFKNSQSAPPLVITTDETLRYTSTIYTHKIFNLFLNEYHEGVLTS
jgi:hypothetical protein